MRRRLVHLVAGLLLAAALAGCGGGNGGMMGGRGGMMGSSPTGTNAGTNTGSGTDTSSGGRALFVEYCGGCHTLAAAGTGGTVGPNLDRARPDLDHVVEVVTNGTGAMPAFGSRLTRAQVQAIARYVNSAAR